MVHPFGTGVCINWLGDLSTFDGDGLTRLVLLAHQHGVRIEIGPSGPQRLRIIAHRRVRGRKEGIGFSRFHPDLLDLRKIVARSLGSNEKASS